MKSRNRAILVLGFAYIGPYSTLGTPSGRVVAAPIPTPPTAASNEFLEGIELGLYSELGVLCCKSGCQVCVLDEV